MADFPLHPVWNSIDGILVINLDTSPERMEKFVRDNSAHLPMDKVQRLSAVWGRGLPTYGKAPWFTAGTGDRAKFWGGTAGCALSHRRAIEHARRAGWRNVLILEDDAVVRPHAEGLNILAQALTDIRGDYMLYLGFNKPVPYGSTVIKGEYTSLWQVEGVLATHGYILPASMYDRLLSLLPTEDNVWEWLSEYRAVDAWYRDFVSALPGVRIYALYPVLVDQGAGASDIGGQQAQEAEYSCKREPYSYATPAGVLHVLSTPFRRLKVKLNSIRTHRRALRGGLPGYRKRRKKKEN
ncbi:MAG: glycosyltransferase family 25 protein [Akkermansiaceae bacterium]|nr:glycosyltransferase family 25 protein [Akkermansiaceae bacterium]